MPTSAWFVLGAALLTAVAVLVRNRVTTTDSRTFGDYGVVEYVAAMIGLVYAVVLGLAVVSVSDTLASASGHVPAQAGDVREIYLLAGALPERDEAAVKRR